MKYKNCQFRRAITKAKKIFICSTTFNLFIFIFWFFISNTFCINWFRLFEIINCVNITLCKQMFYVEQIKKNFWIFTSIFSYKIFRELKIKKKNSWFFMLNNLIKPLMFWFSTKWTCHQTLVCVWKILLNIHFNLHFDCLSK